MESLTKNLKVIKVIDATAAGQTAINSTAVDMSGFEKCMFIVAFGTITSGAATSIKVQQDTTSAMGTATDLTGTSVTVADTGDNKLYTVEVIKPLERYIRLVVSRADQNSVVDSGIAIVGGGHKLPITADSSVASSEVHASPAEGTA